MNSVKEWVKGTYNDTQHQNNAHPKTRALTINQLLMDG